MSNWRSFNAELRRRNALARRFEPSVENERRNLTRRAAEAREFEDRVGEKEALKKFYTNSFFITEIDDLLYLESSIDHALTDENGSFIGYLSEDGINYTDTPRTRMWEQDEYGQYFIQHNYNELRYGIQQLEGRRWGKPRISQATQERMNAYAAALQQNAAIKAAKREAMLRTLPGNNGSNAELQGGRRRRTRRTRRNRKSRRRRSKH
jgi:hypothetical protein